MVVKGKGSNSLKWMLIVGVVFSLVVSAILSLNSFTGYIIYEEKDAVTNLAAFWFFLAGIAGTLFYLKIFK